MSDTPIRIGIIGAGAIVKRRHLPGFRDIPDCEVVAVHNRRSANAEAVAKEWGIPNVVDSPEAVYGRDDINVVLVGTTPYLHRDLTLAALEAGKHVFCQARMSRNLAEARDMLAAAEKHSDLVTMICPAPRADPVDSYIQQLLKEGALGEIRLVRVQHLSDLALDPATEFHWRMDKDVSGNQIQTLGQYVEILNRWFDQAISVSAWGKVFTQQRKDAETGEMKEALVPETVCVSGELKNGAHIVYTFSAVAPCSTGEHIEIYGTEGALAYTPGDQQLRMGKAGSGAMEPLAVPEGMGREWTVEADFVSAIRQGTSVYPNFRDGLAYMEFMEAVALSLEQGKTITLPL
ncbi:MAG: Gfo/Idh/MocA family oxidoreductase [SAR324 cluster bacterium]|nr:Gfo/Idh/MocA family oxidoreductase [SAR324 cluster bacterium]MCZ6646497.1 Gfo/Idh/MocA family oxidoreductase [SAR324 cluster bacterium]